MPISERNGLSFIDKHAGGKLDVRLNGRPFRYDGVLAPKNTRITKLLLKFWNREGGLITGDERKLVALWADKFVVSGAAGIAVEFPSPNNCGRFRICEIFDCIEEMERRTRKESWFRGGIDTTNVMFNGLRFIDSLGIYQVNWVPDDDEDIETK